MFVAVRVRWRRPHEVDLGRAETVVPVRTEAPSARASSSLSPVPTTDRVRVEQVMRAPDAVVPATTPVRAMLAELRWSDQLAANLAALAEPDRWWIVADSSGSYVGTLTCRQVLLAQLHPGFSQGTVGRLAADDGYVAYPDEPARELLRRMIRGDRDWLPVVERNASRHLLGYVSRDDVLPRDSRPEAHQMLRERLLGV